MSDDDMFLSYFSRPYEDMISSDMNRIAALDDEREKIRQKRDSLFELSATDSGKTIGSALLPLLGAWAGSGNITDGLSAGSAWGLRRYGELDAENKERQKLFDYDVGVIDAERNETRDDVRAVRRQQADTQKDLGLQYFTGNIPGTGPWGTEQDMLNERNRSYLQSIGRIPQNGSGYTRPSYEPVDDQTDTMIRQAYGLPEKKAGEPNLTPKAIELIDKGQDNSRTGRNVDSQIAQRGKDAAAGLIAGWLPIPGLEPAEKIDKFRELDSRGNAAVDSLAKLEALMQKRRDSGDMTTPLYGDDAQLAELLGKPMIAYQRAAMGTGASLTGSGRAGEVMQLLAATPPGSDEMPQSAAEALVRYMKGQDSLNFVQELRKYVNSNRTSLGKSYNMYNPELKDFYAPEQAAQIEGMANTQNFGNPWGNYADVFSRYRNGSTLMAPRSPTGPAAPALPGGAPTPPPTPPAGPDKFSDPAYLAWKRNKGLLPPGK